MNTYDKHYGSGSANKQQPKQAEDIQLTYEKQNKYYSAHDNDGTIRKRLIDEYPEDSDEHGDNSGK